MRRYYFDLLANTVAPSSNRGMECRYMQPSRKKLSARSPLWSGMQSARECSTNQMPIQVRDGGGGHASQLYNCDCVVPRTSDVHPTGVGVV